MLDKNIHREVTKTTMKMIRATNPSSINWGNCYNWAAAVFLRVPDAELITLKNLGGHAIVKVGNFYYDSEHPDGVSEIEDLGYFVAWNRDPVMAEFIFHGKDLKSFKEYWDENGGSGRVKDVWEYKAGNGIKELTI